MPDIFSKLVPNLDASYSSILKIAVILAAIATIVMALLEAVKAIAWLRIRPRFHQRRLRLWMGQDAFDNVVALTVGDMNDVDALVDQPTNKVMAQVQAAANIALDFPQMNAPLYDVLTRGTSDAQTWLEFSKQLPKSQEELAGSADAMLATQARGRLDHLVARRLDALQTQTEYRWARGNQYVAFFVTVGFIAYLLRNNWTAANWGLVPLLCIFGGVLAPVAKDVSVALTGLRTKVT
jgi:hypothetical protein